MQNRGENHSQAPQLLAPFAQCEKNDIYDNILHYSARNVFTTCHHGSRDEAERHDQHHFGYHWKLGTRLI
jgi:hypothetical protein